MSSQTQQSLKAFTEGSLSREEILHGITYLVVPVIAMVEGVRFGAAQTEAELGLASEFGKYPTAWNLRPLVINHPYKDGNFVSATSSTEIVSDYVFGFVLNTRVEDAKLKMEAWINKGLASENAYVQGFIDRIEADDTVEVSVGFFCDNETKQGTFDGKKYYAIWRNIVPDHLAFLTNETGACSVADGCGVPRINTAHSEEAGMSMKTDCGCGCKGAGSCQEPTVNGVDKPSEFLVNQKASEVQEVSMQIVAQAAITKDSAETLLREALIKHLVDAGHERWDFYMMMSTAGDPLTAVFQVYTEYGYVTRGIHYTMDDVGVITFQGSPFAVRVVTHVYEVASTEISMPTQSQTGETPSNAAVEVSPPLTANSAGDASSPAAGAKVLSRAEALAAMAPEDRALIEQALQAQQGVQDNLVSKLLQGGCKLEEAFLRAQSADVLEKLVDMLPSQAPVVNSAQPGDYSGRLAPAVPTMPVVQGINEPIEPPKVF